MTLHGVVATHRAHQLQVTAAAQKIAEARWRARTGRLLDGWAKEIPGLVQITRVGMTVAATGSDAYVTASLTQQGATSESASVLASSFAETANDGRALGGLLYMPAITAANALTAGASEAEAMRRGLVDLLMYVGSEIADAGRSAVGVSMLANRRVNGYYREPGGKCCDRCAVLVGKWFKAYSGASFARHPRCRCTAVAGEGPGSGNPVAQSPQSYFASLPAARQDAVFGVENAQAIRDGADISQVVNAQRGMTGAWTTAEGTTKAGQYGGYTTRGVNGAPRLTPAAIYRLSASREEAVQMFRDSGYLR